MERESILNEMWIEAMRHVWQDSVLYTALLTRRCGWLQDVVFATQEGAGN